MGYYTSYTLKIKEGDPFLLEDFITGNSEAEFALYNDGSTRQEAKWYEHEDDLCAFSTQHPNTLFELHCIGGEVEDIWYKYFKGGKMQISKATVTSAPYDESLLQ